MPPPRHDIRHHQRNRLPDPGNVAANAALSGSVDLIGVARVAGLACGGVLLLLQATSAMELPFTDGEVDLVVIGTPST